MKEYGEPPAFEDIRSSLPTPERQEFVANQIGNAYRELLINGGLITHSGKILAHTYNDVQTENLTTEQLLDLTENWVSRLSHRRAYEAIPEQRRAGKSFVYIVRPGLFERLVVKHRKKTDWFYIRKTNEKGQFDTTVSISPNLYNAFCNYSGRILELEGMKTPGFPVAKYTTAVLKQVIDEREAEEKLDLQSAA